jgi:hypothetical protein
MRWIIDTNVLVAANGNPKTCPQANRKCVGTVRQFLDQVKQAGEQRSGKLLLDNGWHILREYKKNVSDMGKPSVGDEFLLWLLQNRKQAVEWVTITSTGENEFAEFPVDPDLQDFDLSDRKFVAVALTHPEHPPIYNAVDSDWKIHQLALERHGIQIEFLCPDCLKAP